MKDALISILETYKYPVYLQGSLAADEAYPDTFFTFWNDSTDDGSHYDNDAIFFTWSFTVYFYSTDPALVNSMLDDVRAELRKAGWNVNGKGYDVPTDQKTHTGRAIDVFYIETNIRN